MKTWQSILRTAYMDFGRYVSDFLTVHWGVAELVQPAFQGPF